MPSIFDTSARPASALGAMTRSADPSGLRIATRPSGAGGSALLDSRGRPPIDAPPRRRKLWDLDTTLHCSIIGTCVTTGELQALVRRLHDLEKTGISDHEIHSLAVGAAATKNLLSKQIQKTLDRRHKPVVSRFARAISAEQVEELWGLAMQSGEIPGAYWAVMTHPHATTGLARRAFGNVHMLSHLVGSANRADIRRLNGLEADNAALRDKLSRQQDRLRQDIGARDAKIRQLSAMLAAAIENGADRDTRKARDADDRQALLQLVSDLNKQLGAETRRRERAEKRAADLAAKNAADRDALASAQSALGEMQAEIGAVEALANRSAGGETSLSATRLRLAGLKLLYVGGRPHQIPHLKEVVEAASGSFFHHDGGLEQRDHLLPGLISRVDIALFPVDCVSHGAVVTLKRLCTQAGKPYKALRSSGLASLLHALGTLVRDDQRGAAVEHGRTPL